MEKKDRHPDSGRCSGTGKLTCLEQLASDDLVTHSNQQVQLLKDIANVLGRTEEKMTVTRLITLLESQPDVQKN